MATESVAASTRPADVGLRREMGLIGAMWSSETSIIGSGWLFGSFFAAQAVGGAALVAWALGGVAVIILALVFAELGAMYPLAGGTARFPHFAFGSVAGTSFGFFSWLQAVTVAPIECYAVMKYGYYFWHSIYNPTTGNVTGVGFAMTIVLLALFTALNFFAMRLFNKINAGIAWWKVAVPILAIIVLAFKFHGANLTAGGGFFPKGVGLKALFAAIPGASIVFAYLGFEQADQLAGEVKNPQRNLPRAIIGAILIGTAIYMLLQLVFLGATPASLLHHGFAGIPGTSEVAIAPFAGLASVVGFGWLSLILRLDGFISPAGTGLIYMTSTSRVGYGLGRNRYYPQIFTRVDSRGVPWVSLILAFVLGLAFLLPFPSWHSLVSLVTAASVLMYAGAPLSMGAFRRQVPEADRPYRMPAARVLAPIAFIIANLIIYWSGFETLWKLGIAMVVGYVLIGLSMAFDKDRPPLDWKAAQWLPVYLIVMGLISWQGQYGPDNTGRIGFGWDILVVTLFSLGIYYWAQFARLPREEMLELVSRQAATPATDAPPAPAA
ncbi:MAG TPA: APC family permease [Streptosporangiaceae bacterium]|nr:APC family permease [Streptosporangiaceae bacterium]